MEYQMQPLKVFRDLSVAVATLIVLLLVCGCVQNRFGLEVKPKSEVSLTVGDKETFVKLLDQHHGQVVLVDFWATWCGPCLQQFPHNVMLSEMHRNEGLSVISVSMDEPDAKADVLEYLKKQKARFANLLTEYGAGAKFVEAFDLRGDVPFYRLYDRQGQLRYSFSEDPAGVENCEPIDRIDERVVQLLSEPHDQVAN